MTEESQPYNLRTLRKLLIAAFDTEELRALVSYDDSLSSLAAEFAPTHPITAMADETITWCDRRGFIPYLVQLVKQERPDKYKIFEPNLFASAIIIPSARFNLPADLYDFTGRHAQIDRVRDRLHQQGTVAINGMGGIGKTALAVHVAHQLIAEGRFRDAQLYIDLKGTDTPPVDPVDALESLLNAILDPNPNRPRDTATLAAFWRQAIDGKDAILILDNAADAVQVRPLLPGCLTCAVLVTSRRRFNLPGARRLDLRPMQPAEARSLLQELAPHLDDDGADKIAGLCGRLPQALRVAGNYLGLNDDVTPESYAEMLADERTRLAKLHDPDDPDLDVYATIALSVAQLDDDPLDAGLRRAWALLSLFPAPFDLPAAAALWDEPDEGQVRKRLQALRNRSLVTYDADSARYHQHDLVRLAAAGELETLTEQEAEAARLGLAHHYVGVAREANSLYTQGGEGVLQALALFDLEWPHIRAGQAWAAAHVGDDEAACLCSDFPNAARYYLALRLHHRDWIVWLEAAARAARRLDDRKAEGVHLGNLGLAYQNLGETHRAVEYITAGLDIAREIGDRSGEGNSLGNLGVAYHRLGETQTAIKHYTAALDIAQEIGDRRGEGTRLGNLGSAYNGLGETHKAIDCHQQALAISQEIGDRRREGLNLGNLGDAHLTLGEAERAIEYCSQALEIVHEIGDRRLEAFQRASLGEAYAALGRPTLARDYWTQALAIFEAIGDPIAERVRQWLAELDD